MNKRDINLFKAAGGERAKGTKRSPIFYMIVLAIVVTTIAVGVGVYFNMKVMAAEDEYKAKQLKKANYTTTKANITDNATEYQKVIANIQAAQAIDKYIAGTSKLYPHATDSEVAAIKATILAAGNYQVDEPIDDEPVEAWDYESIRQAIYSEEEGTTNIEEKSLFYYALETLQSEQETDTSVRVWHGYYRGYMVIVFTGGNSGTGVGDVVNNFYNKDLSTMNGYAPFMRLEWGEEIYTGAKYGYVNDQEITYNVVLCPMKSVIDRMFDILEETSGRLFMEGDYSDEQVGFVSYAVDNIQYHVSDQIELDPDNAAEQQYLSFDLILPGSQKFTDYMRAFSTSVFFRVSSSTVETGRQMPGDYYSYEVQLHFTGKY